jgi:hypothetical protein
MEPTSQPDSTLKVCLINKDLERETRVEIRAGRDFEVASRLRLAAPSAEAKTGGNARQCNRRRSWPMVAATGQSLALAERLCRRGAGSKCGDR